MPEIAPCAAHPHIPEVNPMNHSATTSTHAAHVAEAHGNRSNASEKFASLIRHPDLAYDFSHNEYMSVCWASPSRMTSCTLLPWRWLLRPPDDGWVKRRPQQAAMRPYWLTTQAWWKVAGMRATSLILAEHEVMCRSAGRPWRSCVPASMCPRTAAGNGRDIYPSLSAVGRC